MKKMFLLLLLNASLYTSKAQEIIVKKYEENDRKGYHVTLENDISTVSSFIISYFKETGKVKLRNGIYNINGLSRADFPFPEITIYSELKSSNENTRAIAWLADSLIADEDYSRRLETIWYTFALEFYRHLVQEEINKSNQALRYAEKQYQRLEKDSLNLKNSLENNRKEKVKLEEALKNNEENYNLLLQKIENNSYGKDSVIVAIDKIKKLINLQEDKKKAIQ